MIYLNILSWNFLYLFKMYEQGGGQVTCYWLSIVCFWQEIIHGIVPTLRYIFNTKLRWYWTLNFVFFLSQIINEIFIDRFVRLTWNYHMGYMIPHIIWRENCILLSATELVEFHGIRGCVWKAIIEKKCLYIQAIFINTTQNGLAQTKSWS